jgi:hypothetical protein
MQKFGNAVTVTSMRENLADEGAIFEGYRIFMQ